MTPSIQPEQSPTENPPGVRIPPGQLRARLVERTEKAVASGALSSIPTDAEFIDDGGVRFLVRVLSNLKRKDAERRLRETQEKKTGRAANPFLPYEKALYVGDVSETHAAVLNKYNVVDHHLLIITRRFEDQEQLLTPADFEALARCMNEYDALGFYNGGVEAGASQRHKHLQMVPLPLVPGGAGVPMEARFDAVGRRGEITTVPSLPFRHGFCRLPEDVWGDAMELHGLYRALYDSTGLRALVDAGGKRQSGPYCFLATRAWLLLVPRSREFFDGVSVNSLGYAGGLLVRDEKQLDRVRRTGPMGVLTATAWPADGRVGA